ncbi:MAG: 3-deoxy-7-phosphoheptulonate synthase [Chloroflexi bacterium]|nr:MAG: 3-deoxy-7-phosphoheptulonate synthase [Chloroflexota bacterium]RLC88937.1 MAG: 3-deoxy-7-phosphoheptulonate synthase [Chloroflexota bacterium]HEY66865.1 3-deoxy-7-phosphoheptulonate synthase [Thermoflexia bacterium]
MIVVMKKGATNAQIANVAARIEQLGCRVHISEGEERTIIGVIGNGRPLDREQIERMAGVERTVPILRPFKLASREFHPQDTIVTVTVNGIPIGGRQLIVMAGPCAVESREQLLETAHAVKEAGAHVLRGGAFKPRTSPYSFQGLGEKGLRLLAEAREETGLPVVTEVMEPQMVPLVTTYADILQVGARNMQNYALLHAVGEAQRPVLLKRGMMSTVEELLMAAEYILSHGNDRVILCERGIRTFEHYTRNTLDISAVPLIKQLSHLPVIVDPSHGTGKWELVEPVSRAAVAAGADGLIIEVHPHPEEALSDGAQSLKPARFAALMRSLRPIAAAVERTL